MIANAKVAQRLEGFVAMIQAETNAYYANHYSILTPPTIEVEDGSKYYKVVKTESGSCGVHCFVSKANGDIYKAATWRAPAKHVRGNIFDANYGWGTAVNVYGANYIR